MDKRSFIQQLYQLISPYWRSEEKFIAWSMLIAIFILNMSMIYCAVLLNTWNGSFYNALQKLDKNHFNSLLLQFFGIVIVYISIYVAELFFKAYLSFKWRIWLTNQVMGDWLHNSTFCKLFTYQTKTENPDQRISQDLSVFASSSIYLFFSIITQFVQSFTFAVILWELSSGLLFPLLGGRQLHIPGYMLWITIIYSIIATFFIYKAGSPLVALNYNQERVEANFRFSLMRIRERRDEVSILDGSQAEKKFLNKNIFDIINNYRKIIYRNIYVNYLQNFSANLTTVVPVLAVSPMFFSGAMTLGVLMQIVNAFGTVQGSLLTFAMDFQSFASWKANFNRIVDFRTEMSELTHNNSTANNDLEIHSSTHHTDLEINNLTLHLPQSRNLINFDFHIKPQERVLIMGRSGMGKSTLLKCIAGHWPYATGRIKRPHDLNIIPQKPYFPIGTLRDSLFYPNFELALNINDTEIKRVLCECALENLQTKLDAIYDWNSILSLGEQQRLNFARIILAKPNWIILDEPTNSMDRTLEIKLFTALFKELPDITVLTIGHDVSLKDLHTRHIEI